MTVLLRDGKVVLFGGKVGTSAKCCCCCYDKSDDWSGTGNNTATVGDKFWNCRWIESTGGTGNFSNSIASDILTMSAEATTNAQVVSAIDSNFILSGNFVVEFDVTLVTFDVGISSGVDFELKDGGSRIALIELNPFPFEPAGSNTVATVVLADRVGGIANTITMKAERTGGNLIKLFYDGNHLVNSNVTNSNDLTMGVLLFIKETSTLVVDVGPISVTFGGAEEQLCE